MKAYVYEYLSVVSEAYHSGGGAVIVTNRDPQEVWDEVRPTELEGHPVDGDLASLGEPNAVYDIAGAAEEQVFIFPDSGCC